MKSLSNRRHRIGIIHSEAHRRYMPSISSLVFSLIKCILLVHEHFSFCSKLQIKHHPRKHQQAAPYPRVGWRTQRSLSSHAVWSLNAAAGRCVARGTWCSSAGAGSLQRFQSLAQYSPHAVRARPPVARGDTWRTGWRRE